MAKEYDILYGEANGVCKELKKHSRGRRVYMH